MRLGQMTTEMLIFQLINRVTTVYLLTMSRIRNAFKPRNLLIWAITLLIVPFGFTLRDPKEEIGAFLGK